MAREESEDGDKVGALRGSLDDEYDIQEETKK